jgi:2'-5' RNA ligase
MKPSKAFRVTATWDPEAGVFTSESDIPGLVVEAESFDELISLVEALAPDVIAANMPDEIRPYRVHVEMRRDLAVA